MINRTSDSNQKRGSGHRKKRLLIIVGIILFPFIVYFLGTIFMKRTDVYLEEYQVSSDQTEIQMKVFVGSSMGYIGRYTVKYKDNGIYITFYSTIGGLNSSIGAGNLLTISPREDSEAIYFNRDGNTFEKKLEKDEASGIWYRTEN